MEHPFSHITRKSETEIARLLDYFPALAIVAPSQADKIWRS
jgi:hypothetical protein